MNSFDSKNGKFSDETIARNKKLDDFLRPYSAMLLILSAKLLKTLYKPESCVKKILH